jgi:hypothetical protein
LGRKSSREDRLKIYDSLTIDIESGQILEEDSYDYSGPLLLCDRSLNQAGKNAATTATTTGGNEGAQANQIGSSLIPGLEQQANNPTGFSPTDLNNQTVAAEQSTGGANSAITGEAGLHAGRTHNAGGYAGALDEAARDKSRTLSSDALGVQNQNAQLKQTKQHEAQQQLQGLYGTDTSAMIGSMGLVPKDIDAAATANQSGWLQDVTGVINSLSNAAKALKSGSSGS